MSEHERRPKVLAIAAGKGGVGKTTTCLYVAALAAQWLRGTVGCPVVGLIDRDESRNLTRRVELEPYLVAPGVLLLSGTHLPDQGRGLELVIIDTPPGLTSIESLREAQLVLVPVQPETNGVITLTEYLHNLDLHRITVSPEMRLVALLPTMVGNTLTHARRVENIRTIASQYRPPLAVLTPVPRRIRIENMDLSAPEYITPTEELFDHAGILPQAPVAR